MRVTNMDRDSLERVITMLDNPRNVVSTALVSRRMRDAARPRTRAIRNSVRQIGAAWRARTTNYEYWPHKIMKHVLKLWNIRDPARFLDIAMQLGWQSERGALFARLGRPPSFPVIVMRMFGTKYRAELALSRNDIVLIVRIIRDRREVGVLRLDRGMDVDMMRVRLGPATTERVLRDLERVVKDSTAHLARNQREYMRPTRIEVQDHYSAYE
jgi:hypothetical protein